MARSYSRSKAQERIAVHIFPATVWKLYSNVHVIQYIMYHDTNRTLVQSSLWNLKSILDLKVISCSLYSRTTCVCTWFWRELCVYTRGQVEGFGGDNKLVNDLGRNEQMEDEKNDVDDEVAVVEGKEEDDVV